MHIQEPGDFPINDFLRDDTLLKIARMDPWYAIIVNYIVADYVPPRVDRKKLVKDNHIHLWDELYLFRVCADGLLRHCVPFERRSWRNITTLHMGGHYDAFHTHVEFGKAGSIGVPCTKMPNILCRDAPCVKGMVTSIRELQCP